jgi:hypothetical protein
MRAVAFWADGAARLNEEHSGNEQKKEKSEPVCFFHE